jgi:hypothetical protein
MARSCDDLEGISSSIKVYRFAEKVKTDPAITSFKIASLKVIMQGLGYSAAVIYTQQRPKNMHETPSSMRYIVRTYPDLNRLMHFHHRQTNREWLMVGSPSMLRPFLSYFASLETGTKE